MQGPENNIPPSPRRRRPDRPPLYGDFPEPVDEMIERTSYGRGAFRREKQTFREFYETQQEAPRQIDETEQPSTEPPQQEAQPRFLPPTSLADAPATNFINGPQSYPADKTAEHFMDGRPHGGSRAGDEVAAAFIGETHTSKEYTFSRGTSVKVALSGMKKWITERLRSPKQHRQAEDPFAPRQIHNTEDGPTDATVPSIKV